MKTFELLKFQLSKSGILPLDSSPRARQTAIVANCVSVSACIVCLLTTGWFFLFTAQTNSEYVDGCVFYSSIFFASWYLICMWNKEKLMTLFADLDAIIVKSK